MKIWVKAGIIILTLAIELILGSILPLEMVKPDLILIVVICLAFLSNPEEGAIVGFAGGLVKDIFSINLLGTHALVKTVVGYISGIIKEKIFYQHLLWIIIVVVFIFTILNNTLVYYLLKSLYTNYVFLITFKKYILIQAITNSILAPIIFSGVKKLLIYVQKWN